MSMTLTALPVITSPVTPSQARTLEANVAAISGLNERMVLALSVLAKIYQLSVAGTNYIADHKQLRIDATAFMGALPLPMAQEANMSWNRRKAVIDWNAGYAATNTLGTDVNTLVKNMSGFRDTPEATLQMFYLFLLYKLAV